MENNKKECSSGEQCREEFEAWAKTHPYWDLSKNNNGNYIASTPLYAWKGWQAAWNSRKQTNLAEPAGDKSLNNNALTKETGLEPVTPAEAEQVSDKYDIGSQIYLSGSISSKIPEALEIASEILLKFKGEPNSIKQEEWEACYARLFEQMVDMVSRKKGDK